MLRMRQVLSRVLFARMPQRNFAYSALFVVTSCVMVWSGIANLANDYDGVRSSIHFVLGLAGFAVGLQMLVQAIYCALPDSRRQTKLRLRVVGLSLAAVTLALIVVCLVIRYSAS